MKNKIVILFLLFILNILSYGKLEEEFGFKVLEPIKGKNQTKVIGLENIKNGDLIMLFESKEFINSDKFITFSIDMIEYLNKTTKVEIEQVENNYIICKVSDTNERLIYLFNKSSHKIITLGVKSLSSLKNSYNYLMANLELDTPSKLNLKTIILEYELNSL